MFFFYFFYFFSDLFGTRTGRTERRTNTSDGSEDADYRKDVPSDWHQNCTFTPSPPFSPQIPYSRHVKFLQWDQNTRFDEEQANGNIKAKITKDYEYKIGDDLSESVLTFDIPRPLAAILVSRD